MPAPGPLALRWARPQAIRLAGLAGLLLAIGGPGHASELFVGAAASLREVTAESARAFEARHSGVRVRVSYGASSVLAAQVRAGAPFDLLLSADERIVAELARAGRVTQVRALARKRLAVVATPGVRLRGPADLVSPGVRRIAVPEHAVPVGRYAREWLARRSLLETLASRIVPTEHARATLVAVDQGLVDAAIVYATDAPLARRARVAFAIPEGEQPRILYAGAVVAGSRNGSLAGEFLAFVAQGPGRAAFTRAGFAPPEAP